MYIQHQLQGFFPSSYVMKFEQTRISLSYLNTETNQKWCRHHGLLPSPFLSAWGHFEKDQVQHHLWRYTPIHPHLMDWSRRLSVACSASHGRPPDEDPVQSMVDAVVAEVSVSLGERSGEIAARARCRCLWLGVHSAHTLATWVKDEGLCCSRTTPVLMLPEEFKKREEKKKERKNTHKTPHF